MYVWCLNGGVRGRTRSSEAAVYRWRSLSVQPAASLACRQSLLCVTVTAAAAAWPWHGDKNHVCRWISYCVSRVSGTKSRSRPSTSRSRLTATSLLNLVPISLTTRRKRLEEGNRNSHLSAIWLIRGALTLPLPRPRQAEPRTAAPVGGTGGAGPSR